MPYRLRDSCALCHQASAKARCLRCGAPLCEVHAHGARERCAQCEEEFEAPAEPANVVDWALRIGIVIALGGIFVTGLVIAFASPTSFVKWQVLFLLSPWFVLMMALAIVGLVFGIRANAWYARWRFLRDRLARGRSDQPGSDALRHPPANVPHGNVSADMTGIRGAPSTCPAPRLEA